MNELQRHILNELKAFDSFCRKNKLTYISLGGTMLGAFRHKGFIPWDDDADVGMPRKDFEKFLNLAKDNFPEPYKIRHFSIEKSVPYVFAHIENKNTTYIELRRSGKNYKGGVYLEIFPLDFQPESFSKQKKLCKKIFLWKKLLYIQIMPKSALGKNPAKWIIWFLVNSFMKIQKTTEYIDSQLKKYPESSGIYGNLLGHWGLKENFKSEVLFPPKEYKFEDFSIFGVNKPEEYLSQMYGKDYMTPPSDDKIKDFKHEPVFVDYNKPYSEM